MYGFLKLLSAIFCRMPRSMALALGTLMIRPFALLNIRRKAVCFKNMEILLAPGLSEKEKSGLVSGMYCHFGKCLGDFMRLSFYKKQWPAHLIDYEGKEEFLSAYARGKGIILITAHLGFWELLFACMNQMGVKGTAVVKDIRNKGINRFIMEQRDMGSVFALHKKNSAQEIIKFLKKGGLLGFILDQNMNSELGAFVDFGSEKACTLSAPALLAARYDVPVFGGFVIRTPDDRYQMVFTPEIRLVKSGNREEDLIANTQIFSNVIRDMIRRYPEQWIWLHKRFKNRPEGSPKLYGG